MSFNLTLTSGKNDPGKINIIINMSNNNQSAQRDTQQTCYVFVHEALTCEQKHELERLKATNDYAYQTYARSISESA